MDVNGDVPKGSLLWCPDFGICNQYLIVTDTYTNGETNQLNAKAMGFQTTGLTDSALIEGINKLAASKFAGPFGTLSNAINWAIYEGYFIINQEYPAIVTSGCVLNLDSNFPPSYPLVFNTWYDLTGNGNTGLLNNGITYNSALRGSLLLNGTNQYVSFSATTNIPVGNSNYTISTWFNPSTISGDRGLVGWGNYGTTNEVNALRLSSTGLVNYWQGNDLTASYSFSLGSWYNAVATFNGTTRSIWVNGSLISSDTPVGHNVPNSTNLTVGVTNTTEYFAGNMGEVQIFNRALSSTEISDNYNALLPRYNGTYTDPCSIAPQCTRTPTMTPTMTPTTTPVYYYYLVYDVNINCNAYDGVVYRSATDYSSSILTGQYTYVNGNFLSLKYIETTYPQAFVNTLNSLLITSCVIPSSTPTQTPSLTPQPVYYYYSLTTCWGEPSSNSVGRSTSSSYGTAVFLSGGICFQSNGITSGPSYDLNLDSLPIIDGGCEDSACNPPLQPTPAVTTTPTATPAPLVWNLYFPCGTTTPASQVLEYSSNYLGGEIIKGSNGLCYTIAISGRSIASTISVDSEYGTCEDCEISLISPTPTQTLTKTPTSTPTATIVYQSYDLYYPCGSTTPADLRVPFTGNQTIGEIILASNGLCYTIAGPTTVGGASLTIISEHSTCEDCEISLISPTPTKTPTSTPTSTPPVTPPVTPDSTPPSTPDSTPPPTPPAGFTGCVTWTNTFDRGELVTCGVDEGTNTYYNFTLNLFETDGVTPKNAPFGGLTAQFDTTTTGCYSPSIFTITIPEGTNTVTTNYLQSEYFDCFGCGYSTYNIGAFVNTNYPGVNACS